MTAVVIPPLERLKCPAWRYPDSRGHQLRVLSEDLYEFDIGRAKTYRVHCSCDMAGARRGTPEAAIEWLYRAMAGETR